MSAVGGGLLGNNNETGEKDILNTEYFQILHLKYKVAPFSDVIILKNSASVLCNGKL